MGRYILLFRCKHQLPGIIMILIINFRMVRFGSNVQFLLFVWIITLIFWISNFLKVVFVLLKIEF